LTCKIFALDIGVAPYSFVIARELKRLGYDVFLGIPFNEKIKPGIVLALKDYKKFLYPDPLFSEQAFINWITSVAHKYSFNFIMPFIEHTQLAVAKIKKELEDEGITIPISDYWILRKVVDKTYIIKEAKRLGLRLPQTIFLTEPHDVSFLIEELGLPFIIKVSNEINVPPGLGSRFYVFRKKPSRDQFNRIFMKLARHGTVIAQEYIEGIGVGAEFLFNRFGELVAVAGHKRVVEAHKEGGYSVSAYTYIHPDAIKQGFRLLKSLNWKGVAMVEFKESKDGRIFFMELNPRFWGTTPLALHSQVNFTQLLIEYFNKHTNCLHYPKRVAYFVSLLRALKRAREDMGRNGIMQCLRTFLEMIKKARGNLFIAELYEYPLKYFALIPIWYIRRLKCLSAASNIVNGIYLGPAADHEKIISFTRSEAIECIVDLREKQEISNQAILNALTHGCYFNIPVRDDSVPKREDFAKVLSIINRLVKKHRRIYIGCRLGRGRSSVILLAYLALSFKKPLPYIYLMLMFKRPIVKLSEKQMKFLYSMESSTSKFLLKPI